MSPRINSRKRKRVVELGEGYPHVLGSDLGWITLWDSNRMTIAMPTDKVRIPFALKGKRVRLYAEVLE